MGRSSCGSCHARMIVRQAQTAKGFCIGLGLRSRCSKIVELQLNNFFKRNCLPQCSLLNPIELCQKIYINLTYLNIVNKGLHAHPQ